MEYLSNGIIEIEVSAQGAELQSIRRVTSPTEYLWQGDPTYWERRAPILFPITGKVWNDSFCIDGTSYAMNKHGFLRDMTFTKIVDEDRHLAFSVRADDSTLNIWPYDFEVRIDYTLLRNVMTITWSVTNHDDRTMPFQIGAHPALQYPHFKIDDPCHGYLSFNVDDALHSTVIAPGGFADDKTFDIDIPKDGLLPLGNETFACDTILETTERLQRITLHDKNGRPFVTIRHTMPVTALWSPCKGRAPFVCIEPWHGCCDPTGFNGDFEQRNFIEHVAPGKMWTSSYEMIIE